VLEAVRARREELHAAILSKHTEYEVKKSLTRERHHDVSKAGSYPIDYPCADYNQVSVFHTTGMVLIRGERLASWLTHSPILPPDHPAIHEFLAAFYNTDEELAAAIRAMGYEAARERWTWVPEF
jgi:hypothetical protein